MNSRELMLAAFDGAPTERFPVCVPYLHLMQREHWAEIYGESPWHYYEWARADPDEHVKGYRRLVEALPFDVIGSIGAPPPEVRGRSVVQKRGDGCFITDRKTGEQRKVTEDLAHMEGAANEQRHAFTRADVDERVCLYRAEDVVGRGRMDYAVKTVEVLGGTHFILTGGVVGTWWGCTELFGLTNRFALLREEPDLVEYASKKLLARTIEDIRVLVGAGGDAIWVDDATSTCDCISVADYERFCMPYVREMVREIQSHGHKAILVYFGGVADRVEQIDSLGADGLSVETTMKNYVNDISDVAGRLSGRTCLFGNIDPVGVVQRGTDEGLVAEIERQAAVGRSYGRFVMCTGSPITPPTPLSRIRRFIDLSHGERVCRGN